MIATTQPGIVPINYNAREAAKALSISARTLFDLTKAKRVPHARIGGRLLYPVAELQQWMSDKAKVTADTE